MPHADTVDSFPPASTVSRRGALALGAAASALLLGSRSASADSIRTGGGIAGGGWARWADGEAQLSVFGSRFNSEESDEPILFGSLRWKDASGFTLTSEMISSYGPIEPEKTTRQLVGVLRNSSGDTLHAFKLTLVDGGGPGDQLDMVTLVVGPVLDDAATPTVEIADDEALINIAATLEVGDIQLLTFEFPE